MFLQYKMWWKLMILWFCAFIIMCFTLIYFYDVSEDVILVDNQIFVRIYFIMGLVIYVLYRFGFFEKPDINI